MLQSMVFLPLLHIFRLRSSEASFFTTVLDILTSRKTKIVLHKFHAGKDFPCKCLMLKNLPLPRLSTSFNSHAQMSSLLTQLIMIQKLLNFSRSNKEIPKQEMTKVNYKLAILTFPQISWDDNMRNLSSMHLLGIIKFFFYSLTVEREL